MTRGTRGAERWSGRHVEGLAARMARVARRFERGPARAEARARALLAQMSVAQKAGQLIVPLIVPGSADGVRLSAELRALVTEQQIGGYFVSAAGASAEQVRAFTGELQAAARIPLLLASDFEGGAWNVLESAVGERPAPPAVAATGDAQVAYYKGVVDAELLTSLGIHVNLAPSVDVLEEAEETGHPVLRGRTFGASPDLVSALGAAYVEGLASGGVCACLKHFPGMGGAQADPHVELPVIARTRDEIVSVDLKPFRRLIRWGQAPMIMTAHLLVPALDPELPTSLSPVVINDLLRRVIGYDGVVISDSLAMDGALGRYGIAEASVLAVIAGTDLLLGAPDVEQARASVAALAEAVAERRVTMEQLDAAVLRVLRLKLRWGIIGSR